jgi:SnoaL-like domain
MTRVSDLTADDRAAIEGLLAGYALALDVADVESAIELFTEDGEFRTHERVFAGPDRLRRLFSNAPPGMHLCGRSVITPSPDGATVRSQLVFYPADDAAHRLAIYDDAVIHVDGKWRFRVRHCRFMTADGELSENP